MTKYFLLAFCWLVQCAFAQTKTEDGFAIPQAGRVFKFPRDHGNHPEFRTEWWYITGHLNGENGKRLGFQVTFFRQGSRDDSGAVQHLHLAHAALMDQSTGTFMHEEKLNREGWDATSSDTTLDVRNGNWSLRMDEKTNRLHLQATVKADAAFALELEIQKPLVVFGKDGVSRKGSSPSAASHYLTFPRLRAVGLVTTGSEKQSVSGEAWMDHEFGSSQLDEGQAGWDWAALQLVDGREIMVYRMRRTDGSMDAASTLTVIRPDGTQLALPSGAFSWKALGHWHSPRSQADYPIRVGLTFQNETYELRPIASDQEQGGKISGLPYWEGACDVLDGNGKIVGRAFLELVGYAGDLRQHLAPKTP